MTEGELRRGELSPLPPRDGGGRRGETGGGERRTAGG